MDKKPLIIVSICAVVLLVMGSLSNVVGYQSVKSTIVNDSPLFRTRTQKATNQQQNILTSQYLGMGKETLLKFPIRDNKTELLKKVIEYINKIDDKTFTRFTKLCIQRTRQDKILSDTNPNKIVQILRQFKTQPETITYSLIHRNNQTATTFPFITICHHWYPLCILDYFAAFIIGLFLLIFMVVFLLVASLTYATCNCGP